MHFHTAIVPPRHVLDDVEAAVRDACSAAQLAADDATWRQRRMLPVWRRRREQGADRARSTARQLDLVPADALSIPLAGFGYVTAGDSVRLVAALKDAAAQIVPPTVHFAGGATVEFEGDRQVWVRIAGDVEALTDAARVISAAVEPLGLYVDRRRFRPLLAVGTVNDFTTAPYLQGVLDALDAFSGLPWALDHVDLIRPSYGSGPETQEVDWLPLLG